MGPLAKKKDVSFKVKVSPDTPLLLGDEEVLRRIVVNLVNNALRFTDSGGWVELQLAYREGRFVICVLRQRLAVFLPNSSIMSSIVS